MNILSIVARFLAHTEVVSLPQSAQTDLELHLVCYRMDGEGFFPVGQSGRGVKLTSQYVV
jgi:hypothetical protein